MQSEFNEYVPDASEQKRKIFNLTPAEDDTTLTAIKARTQCLRDRNLSYGARCLFVFLLDQALNPYVFVAKGVVAVSATRIAEYLGCYEKTIFEWIEQLRIGRHIWKDQQYMPNFWAMNRYHITAFDPPDHPSQLPTRDGMWGNGVRRPVAPRRDLDGDPVAKSTRQNGGENLQTIQNQREASGKTTGEALQNPPARAVEKPPVTAVENPPATDVVKPPARRVEKAHAARGENHPHGVVKPTDIRESQLKSEERNLSSKSSSKGLKPAIGEENRFLERMGLAVHQKGGPKALAFETKQYGKQWRMSYREDPDRAERAYLDALADLKEGRIAKSFGATWRLRWNEFASRKDGK